MKDELDKLWAEVAGGLGRKLKLGSLTPEEAQVEFDSLPKGDLPDDQVDTILQQLFVDHDESTNWQPSGTEELEGLELVGADYDASSSEEAPNEAFEEERRLERLSEEALERELGETDSHDDDQVEK